MSDLQTISITIGILTACVSVVIGVVNSIRSSREAREQRQVEIETRQAELFMNAHNRWNTPDIQSAWGRIRYLRQWTDLSFEEYIDKMSLRSGNPENFDIWLDTQLLVTYLEGLGVLAKKNLVDLDMVDDLFSYRIIWYWETAERLVKEVRKIQNAPNMFDGIEYLYHELKHRQRLIARPEVM